VLPSRLELSGGAVARIDMFRMERLQSRYWHQVEYDLSESGVTPLSIEELLGESQDPRELLRTGLGYPLSEGSERSRELIAQWYPGAATENVTMVNGGSEANLITLWTLLEPADRLAFMVPNYMQGWGLGRHFGEATDVFRLKLRDGRWALDVDELDRVVTRKTRAVMVCNPDNPTGHIFTDEEMDAVVDVARRANAWLVADEVYRGAEVDSDVTSPTFWGRYDKVIVTAGLSKAFAMPGLRVGWVVAPEKLIEKLWIHHDYTTLTPGMVSDRLTAVAMEPARREWVLRRTRGILRSNLPRLEEWIREHEGTLMYVRPQAGAIAYVTYRLPITSSKLIDRIREEQSVLLVPGDMFGLGKGFRIGFGQDIEKTLKGLARVDEVLRHLTT
jgi:aspartate/methionine/tyrosine aminotransferase